MYRHRFVLVIDCYPCFRTDISCCFHLLRDLLVSRPLCNVSGSLFSVCCVELAVGVNHVVVSAAKHVLVLVLAFFSAPRHAGSRFRTVETLCNLVRAFTESAVRRRPQCGAQSVHLILQVVQKLVPDSFVVPFPSLFHLTSPDFDEILFFTLSETLADEHFYTVVSLKPFRLTFVSPFPRCSKAVAVRCTICAPHTAGRSKTGARFL
jgi:hypothetical protein